jgi:asparagine synthetase B (glutamine-hydrolysing)
VGLSVRPQVMISTHQHQSSVAIQGTPTIGGRLLTAADLPEVSAQALDQWKALACRIGGQFSIIARSDKASIAVTDATGSWPVFLNQSAIASGFGNAVSSVTSGRQLVVSTQGATRYLAFGNVGGACSLAAGVRTVPGASVCLLDADCETTESWFDWLSAVKPDPSPVEELEKEFRTLVEAWAELCLPRTGRVALLLSGGTDSGLLAAMMSKLLGDRLVCITQEFFLARYSEKVLAAETARRANAAIQVAKIGRKGYFEAFRELNGSSQDVAVWATEAHNLYCLAKYALKQGIQTIITGYGADYLFLGQGQFFNGLPRGRDEYLDAISRITPEEKLKWVLPRPTKLTSLTGDLAAVMGISPATYQRWADEFINARSRLLTPIAPLVPLPKLQQISYQMDGGVEWQGEQGCLAVMRALPECNLICPFYDAAVIRFALKLPPDLIYRDGQTKYILRRIFESETGLVRVKSHASLSPLRYWRVVPDAGEYGCISPALRSTYLRGARKNLMARGSLYNDLARISALANWVGSHKAALPDPK